MIFATPETSFYYNDLVKKQRRDKYLALMFLPMDKRDAAIAIWALDIELEHVHHAVKEEMIGHIRYAWWQENMEKMAGSDQPVLKALSQLGIKPEILKPLVAAYSDVFPNLPQGNYELAQSIVEGQVGGNHKWQKATTIINNHRKKYGVKWESWLLIRLLLV